MTSLLLFSFCSAVYWNETIWLNVLCLRIHSHHVECSGEISQNVMSGSAVLKTILVLFNIFMIAWVLLTLRL